jgi:polygalacturonase
MANLRFSLGTLLFVLICGGCKISNFPTATPKATFDVKTLGATGDGTTLDTDAFKRAIAACQQAGGGTVVVPAGKYLTQPLDMVSNMTLHVEEDATILFSENFSDYPLVETRWEGIIRQARRPCLWAKDCENVAITGKGVIDGQGMAWWRPIQERRRQRLANSTSAVVQTPQEEAERRRGPLVQFRDCKNVKIDGPTFQNSPFWTLHVLFTDHVVIRNAKFLAPENGPNTDAVDIDSCRHVLIENCHADVGDDAFTLKSGRDEDGRRVGRPTEHVTVRNCTVYHAHGGVVIGSETAGSLRHIRFSNLTFTGTDAGVRIKSTRGRGGTVEDVRADNIKMKDVGNTFIITMRYSRVPEEPVSERTPRFHNIHLSNITARDSRTAGVIAGLEEMPIRDITVKNLDVTAREGVSITDGDGIEIKNAKVEVGTAPGIKTLRSKNIKLDGWTEAQRTPTSAPTTQQ